jgi:cap1 methyltransferase
MHVSIFWIHPNDVAVVYRAGTLAIYLRCNHSVSLLQVLQIGGTFICRVYELLSRFSAGLLYILYRIFEEVAILKPMTSCPTSPERFLICRGFTGCKTILIEMLLEVNSRMTELNSSVSSQLEVLEIVPMQQLLGEEQFYRFLTLSNERIARHRTQCITRLEKAMMDNELSLSDEDRTLLRKGTLEILQLPTTPSLPHNNK